MQNKPTKNCLRLFDLYTHVSVKSSLSVLSVLLAITLFVFPLYAQENTAQQPTAVIVSPGLNVRSGPGLSYVVIGYVKQGDALEILSQAESCRWLLVRTAKFGDGWISGKSTYASINVSCDQVSGASNGAVAQPQPTATSITNTNSESVKDVVPTVAPTATPVAEPAQSTMAQPPAGQGCYLLQNRLGPPITVTFTNRDSGQSVQVSVPHGAEVPHCMKAGRYTYTISAAGFKDQNGELKITAGDAYMLPIGAQ